MEANLFVVPGSNYHMRMAAQTRLAHLFDNGEYQRMPVREVPQDPLSSALHVLLDRFGCPAI